jgi:mannosyltransferase
MDASHLPLSGSARAASIPAFAQEEKIGVSERWTLGWLGLLLAVGAFLRLSKLGADSLWLDEIDEVTMAALPLRQLLPSLTWHVSPPLEYLVMHLLAPFGRDETLVRLPAALFGIVAIYVLYQAGRRLMGDAAGLGAAALLTFSLTAISYAQEARMYSLFLLLTSLLLWCCAALIEEPLSWRRWGIAGGVAILTLYTHYYAAVTLFGLGVLWLAFCFWPRWNKAMFLRGFATFSAVALLFAPWVPTLLEQRARRAGALEYALPHSDYWWITRQFVSGGVSASWAWFYLFLFGVGLLYCLRRKPLVAGLLVAFTVIPALLVYFVPALAATMTPRNTIGFLPGYLVGVAIGFYALVHLALSLLVRRAGTLQPSPRASVVLFWVTVLGLVALALVPSYQMLRQHRSGMDWWMKGPRTDWRQTAHFLQQAMRPGDLIVTDNIRTRYQLSFYLDPLAIQGTNFYDFTYNPENTTSGANCFIPIIPSHAPPDALAEAMNRSSTIWLVYPEFTPPETPELPVSAFVPVDTDLNIPVARLDRSASPDTVTTP